MIDRDNRHKVIEHARHYVSGLIDNDDLDALMFDRIQTNDIGLIKVMEQLWHCYNDLSTHKNEGKHKLSENARKDIARYILFLQSDTEYKWPGHTLNLPIPRILSYLFTLGILPYFVDKKFRNSGPIEIWPFFTEKEYKRCLENPTYLNKNT